MSRIMKDVQWCPNCFHRFDMTTEVVSRGDKPSQREAKARPGDVTVCIECATLLRFSAKMKLQVIDEREIDARTRATIRTVQGEIRRLAKERPINVWKN